MRYVHIEDDQVRQAAEKVSRRRAAIVAGGSPTKAPTIDAENLVAGGTLDVSTQQEARYHG
jgi:hypothetical protein